MLQQDIPRAIAETCNCTELITSHQSPESWFEWVSLIASIVTLLGFCITIWQLIKIKNTNKLLKDAVNENTDKIKLSLALMAVTDASRLAEMVMNLIENKHYEQAIIRLQDLNKAVIELSAQHEDLKEHQYKIVSEISHLRSLATEDGSLYRPSYILSTIQQVNNELAKYSAIIKNDKITS